MGSFAETLLEYTNPPPQRSRVARRASGLIYAVVSVAIGILLLAGTLTGGRQSILGYSVFTVLSSSMRSVLPKDSLIFVKNVEPQEIQVGDDITYFRDDNSTITHRVIAIYEDFEESGMRGFQTQGVNNLRPDGDVIYATNVVGRVIFHIPRVGLYLRMIHENIFMSLLICALLIALVEVLHRIVANSRSRFRAFPEETPAEKVPPEDEETLPDEPLPEG